MSLRTGMVARAWAKLHTSWSPSGMCAQFVRSCFGVGAYYGSARLQWLNARYKHRTSDPNNIPPAVPIYWSGGSKGFGHVAFSVGGGLCRSTDWPSRGRVGIARVSDIHRLWGHTLVGWTEDINRVRVYAPPVASSAAAGERAVRLASLRPKRRNADVKDLQNALRRHGLGHLNPSGVTGYYGKETRAMVRAFQKEQGWSGSDADGIVGPTTARLLGLTVRS
jgi:hypothetical protein